MMELTHQERRVILFIMVVALIGLGINFLDKRCAQIRVIGYISQDIGKIDLNRADIDTLIEVPGIGPKLAQRIIDYRKQHGEFGSITELRAIKGFGEFKYKAIKGYFTVD